MWLEQNDQENTLEDGSGGAACVRKENSRRREQRSSVPQESSCYLVTHSVGFVPLPGTQDGPGPFGEPLGGLPPSIGAWLLEGKTTNLSVRKGDHSTKLG